MENNKTYLQKIQWVFLIGLVSSIPFFFLQQWLTGETGSLRTALFIQNIVVNIALYCSLGIVTERWKEAAIAGGLDLMITAALHFLPYDPQKINWLLQLFVLFVHLIPLLLFIALQSGWKPKLVAVYFSLFILNAIFTLGFYNLPWLIEELGTPWEFPKILYAILGVAFRTATFVCGIIFLCELINYAQDKNIYGKTRLLNLGNIYEKMNSIISFWCLKLMILAIVVGGGSFVQNHIRFISYDRDISSDLMIYWLIYGIISIICIALAGLFFAWYIRKFLLENFITYNVRSKFLYWFSLLPVVGFISYLVLLIEGNNQRSYDEKKETMGHFAASSTAAVTTLFFIVLGIRFLVNFDISLVISLIITLVLFIWFMADKTGYYVILVLNLLALAATIIAIITAKWEGPAPPLVFGLVLFNLVQTVFIFPVYHFEEFEYIPAENPVPKEPGEFHLFG